MSFREFICTVVCIIVSLPSFTNAIKCYRCSNNLPLQCQNVQTCMPGGTCYGERTSILGFTGFTSGCLPKKDCVSTGSIIGRRSVYEHYKQCCDTDYCNNELFGIQDIPRSSRGPHCYQCGHGRHSAECNHVVTCSMDEACYVRADPHNSNRDIMGCIPKNSCYMLLQTPFCFGTEKTCCEADYCNEKCVPMTANLSWSTLPTSPEPVMTTTLPTTTSKPTTITTLTKREKCLNQINDGFFYDSFSDICVSVMVQRHQVTQKQASDTCTRHGAELVSVKNRDVEDFLLYWIFSHSFNQTDFWIGARTQVHGSQSYFWSDGSPVTYSNWGNYLMGQPDDRRTKNENCVYLNDKDRYFWHDDLCDSKKTGYICELWNIPSGSDKVHACRKLLFNGFFYDQTTDLCVQFHQTKTPIYTHQQAKNACTQNGATLAIIDTPDKMDFLLRWIFANHENMTDFWIGAEDVHNNSVFYWPNGDSMNYTHWGGPVTPPISHGQPDEHYGVTNQNCVYMDYINNYYWFDEHCGTKKTGFICQLFEQNQTALVDTCRRHLFDGYFYDAYAGMCIKLHQAPSGINQHDSEQKCVSEGSHLAVIDSQTKNNFILQWIFSNKANATDYWIGGYDTHNNGKFFWQSTGAPFTYTNWYTVATPPPENCVYMNNLDKYRWKTTECGQTMSGYICQIV